MKYLNKFNIKLSKFREDKRLSLSDVAEICAVDVSVVKAWELTNDVNRCFPTLENLLDLCFKTGKALEYFIDRPQSGDEGQLELPGLRFIEESDLSNSLEELDKTLENIIPSEMEQELLRRFRKSDSQNKELILQLIAN